MVGVFGLDVEVVYYGLFVDEVIVVFCVVYVCLDGIMILDVQIVYVFVIVFDLFFDEKYCIIVGVCFVVFVWVVGNCIVMGFVGILLVCDVFILIGYVDIVYDLLLEWECLLWLYQVVQGVIMVWEWWDVLCFDGIVNFGMMILFNYYVFGVVVDWLYCSVVGLVFVQLGYCCICFVLWFGGGFICVLV